jgi:CBS domain-containing protein
MQVKEVMVKDVETLSADISVKEAMDILFKRKISGLPVMDKEGRLVGMFTEKNILSYLLPSYIEKVGSFVYEENPKATKKKLNELCRIKVSELMRKEVITTSEDTTLCEAARIMLTRKARRLPVTNKEGKITGIVAREDILKAMNKEAVCA